MKKSVLAASLLLLASGAQAENEVKVVLGGAFSIDSSDVLDDLEDGSGPGISIEDSGIPLGLDIYAGLGFMEASTFRLGYRKFGQQSGDVEFYGFDAGTIELDTEGLYAAVDLMFPVSDTFFLGGTLGYQDWEAELDYEGARDKEDGNDLFYGLRGKWLLSGENGALTAGLNFYDFGLPGNDLEYTSVAVGLEFFL
jgi:hypothetical protein